MPIRIGTQVLARLLLKVHAPHLTDLGSDARGVRSLRVQRVQRAFWSLRAARVEASYS